MSHYRLGVCPVCGRKPRRKKRPTGLKLQKGILIPRNYLIRKN